MFSLEIIKTVQKLVYKLPARVNFSHWKRVDVDGNKKTKILVVDMEKLKSGELFRTEVESFRGHAQRVQIQYGSSIGVGGTRPFLMICYQPNSILLSI